MFAVPIRPVDEGWEFVYYGLTEMGNSQVARYLDRLSGKDSESVDYVATMLQDLEEYGLERVSYNRLQGCCNLELRVSKESPKPLRILARAATIKNRSVVILLKIDDPHKGKTNKFSPKMIKEANRLALEIQGWIDKGGSLDEL